MLLRQRGAEVVLAGGLIDIHAGDGPVGVVHVRAAQIAVEESAADVVGVREVVIGGGHHGEASARLVGTRGWLSARAGTRLRRLVGRGGGAKRRSECQTR